VSKGTAVCKNTLFFFTQLSGNARAHGCGLGTHVSHGCCCFLWHSGGGSLLVLLEFGRGVLFLSLARAPLSERGRAQKKKGVARPGAATARGGGGDTCRTRRHGGPVAEKKKQSRLFTRLCTIICWFDENNQAPLRALCNLFGRGIGGDGGRSGSTRETQRALRSVAGRAEKFGVGGGASKQHGGRGRLEKTSPGGNHKRDGGNFQMRRDDKCCSRLFCCW
jgi:hypothetical protein